MPNIFIKKLTVKDIATSRGNAQKYTIIDENGSYWDSWKDQWNADWKEGQTIEFAESQIRTREYNGKVYKSIAKPSARGGGNAVFDAKTSEIMAVMVNLSNKVDNLTSLVGEIKKKLDSKPGEISVDDIPF